MTSDHEIQLVEETEEMFSNAKDMDDYHHAVPLQGKLVATSLSAASYMERARSSQR